MIGDWNGGRAIGKGGRRQLEQGKRPLEKRAGKAIGKDIPRQYWFSRIAVLHLPNCRNPWQECADMQLIIS